MALNSKGRRSNPGLNFRRADDQSQQRTGKLATSEPTSIKEIFTLMVLYICKKVLFYETNLKVGLYLASLFIISLIADVAPIPRIYLSRSDNVLNKYFVKLAWMWNLMLLVPFVVITTYIYCCGRRHSIIRNHVIRLIIATVFWYCWTTSFNIIEAFLGRCSNKSHASKSRCLHAGSMWNGFDISGHTFILIYGSLVLIEEARSMINWDRIKELIRQENHYRTTKDSQYATNPLRVLNDDDLGQLQLNYERFTPYIRTLFILITLFQILWDVMLVSTMLYYHIMIEKFVGGVIAILTWFFTYRVWFQNGAVPPKLPGDGVFKYIKNTASANGTEAPPIRRRTIPNPTQIS